MFSPITHTSGERRCLLRNTEFTVKLRQITRPGNLYAYIHPVTPRFPKTISTKSIDCFLNFFQNEKVTERK